eukprot:5591135-Pleurochrysis_carterae.AAC.3
MIARPASERAVAGEQRLLYSASIDEPSPCALSAHQPNQPISVWSAPKHLSTHTVSLLRLRKSA